VQIDLGKIDGVDKVALHPNPCKDDFQTRSGKDLVSRLRFKVGFSAIRRWSGATLTASNAGRFANPRLKPVTIPSMASPCRYVASRRQTRAAQGRLQFCPRELTALRRNRPERRFSAPRCTAFDSIEAPPLWAPDHSHDAYFPFPERILAGPETGINSGS